MRPYLSLLALALSSGIKSEDRTGTGTVSIFGTQSFYSLKHNFPLQTTKKLFWKGVVGELLWFISGESSNRILKEHNINFWDAWTDEKGELPFMYGKQLRDFNGVDQLQQVIDGIKSNPYSRRHVITLWNPNDLDKQPLHCCHGTVIQFYVRDGYLSCQMYQRSGDLFLGVPFNVASYSLLTHIVAHLTGLKPGEFIHTLGDAHIYLNHLDQVRTLLGREPKALPTLSLKPFQTLDELTADHIILENYQHHDHLAGELSI